MEAPWPKLNKPIFILGAPRSGTTFLGSCIAALPEVSYFEEPVLTKIASQFVYEERLGFRGSAAFYRMTYRVMMLCRGHRRRFFAEKTPRNCTIARFLLRVFPDARFIHIIRDGRDSAASGSE